MYKINNFINEALASFEQVTGIKADLIHIKQNTDITLNIRNKTFYGEAKKIGKRTDYAFLNKIICSPGNKDFILIADYLTGKTTETLKKHKINYLDAAGNCYIESDDFLILVEGQKNIVIGKSGPVPAFQETGLKLILLLISNPESLKLPYRELAEKADISLGSVGNILNGLEKDGYLLKTKKGKVLKRQDELIERWVTAYKEVLKPRYFRKRMRLTDNKINLNFSNNLQIYWGGELGGQILTDYLNPVDYTLYSNEELSTLARDLKMAPDENGKVEIYEKFWTDEIRLKKEHTAPALVVYADLINSGNSRNMEIAKMILKNGL